MKVFSCIDISFQYAHDEEDGIMESHFHIIWEFSYKRGGFSGKFHMQWMLLIHTFFVCRRRRRWYWDFYSLFQFELWISLLCGTMGSPLEPPQFLVVYANLSAYHFLYQKFFLYHFHMRESGDKEILLIFFPFCIIPSQGRWVLCCEKNRINVKLIFAQKL